jgi:site-specific recombinase XerD
MPTLAAPIFYSSGGGQWSANSFRMAFRRAIAKASEKYGLNLEGVCPYLFRHSKATDLAVRGLNGKLLADFLGHTSCELLDWYVHSEIGDLCKFLKK